MVVDKFPPLYKTILNIVSVLGLIAGTVAGGVTGFGIGAASGIGYIFGILGFAVGFIGTYAIEAIIITPFILFINFMHNGSEFFAGKKDQN